MSTESLLREMLNTYPRGSFSVDTLSIHHPLISQSYYFTREPAGLIAYLEDEVTQVTYVGTQIQLQLQQTKEDLDQNFSFTFPDIDNKLDDELDNIPLSDTTPIQVIYRSYVNTDLSSPSVKYDLEVVDISQAKGAFTLTCGVSQMNWNRTGITYNFDDFPMLRALV